MDFSFDDHVAASEAFSENEVDDYERRDNKKEEQGKTETSKDPPIKMTRVIRNPQPKLNQERLCGNRGIVTLPKIFENVVLKGKGHEKEDLDKVLKTMEHWSHRLFPKFSFDDALDRIQKLGTKKPLQVCLNKIRLDAMSGLDDDDVDMDDCIDNDSNRKNGDDTNATDDDRFDLLHASIFGEASTRRPDSSHTPLDIFTSPNDPSSACDNNSTLQTAQKTQLTSDQRARMEENRKRAKERLTMGIQSGIIIQNSAKDDSPTQLFDEHALPGSSDFTAVEPNVKEHPSVKMVVDEIGTNTSKKLGDLSSENDEMAVLEGDFGIPSYDLAKNGKGSFSTDIDNSP